MNAVPRATVLLAAGLVGAGAARAQDYRVRVDTRLQAVSFRGVQLDSVPASDTVTGPNGGPETPDGYAVTCQTDNYCTFFRGGPVVHAAPLTSDVDLTAWGFGVPGLSVHLTGRLQGDLSSSDVWPGTDPHLLLLEGYAQYAVERLTVQLGRQTVVTRFGLSGFDGALATLRDPARGLDVTGYGGWGLAQGVALPVTSPALAPLSEFQPAARQLVAGASVGWSGPRADVRMDYQREVDPSVDYFVSERAGADATVRLFPGWSVVAGADYDLAQGFWGNAEASVTFAPPGGRGAATLELRRYRPHFELWTIWGAFSPVPYHALDAEGTLTVTPSLHLRASGERYQFDPAQVSTPLVTYQTSGWRFEWGASYTLSPRWTADGGYHAEFGPGAASRGFDGAVTFTASDLLTVGVAGSTLDRPLEFRFDDASVHLYGVDADWRPSQRVRVALDASRYTERRARPDAAAFDWNQFRVSARLVLSFGGGSDTDLGHLPPATP